MKTSKHKMWAAIGTAVAIAAGTALQAALTDDKVTLMEWVTIVLAGLGAYAVYKVPNVPAVGGVHAKAPEDLTVEE